MGLVLVLGILDYPLNLTQCLSRCAHLYLLASKITSIRLVSITALLRLKCLHNIRPPRQHTVRCNNICENHNKSILTFLPLGSYVVVENIVICCIYIRIFVRMQKRWNSWFFCRKGEAPQNLKNVIRYVCILIITLIEM